MFVIPAKAGIQCAASVQPRLDTGFRRYDDAGVYIRLPRLPLYVQSQHRISGPLRPGADGVFGFKFS